MMETLDMFLNALETLKLHKQQPNTSQVCSLHWFTKQTKKFHYLFWNASVLSECMFILNGSKEQVFLCYPVFSTLSSGETWGLTCLLFLVLLFVLGHLWIPELWDSGRGWRRHNVWSQEKLLRCRGWRLASGVHRCTRTGWVPPCFLENFDAQWVHCNTPCTCPVGITVIHLAYAK